MGKSRSKNGNYGRDSGGRELRKSTANLKELTFSFKDIDFSQPKGNEQDFESWQEVGKLSAFNTKIKEISQLTLEEAKRNKYLKIYGEFPNSEKTQFLCPKKFIDNPVCWASIQKIGGQTPRAIGYIDGETFYVVFLDIKHEFYISQKKNT